MQLIYTAEHSCLFQLLWPPWCKARKYKYFAALPALTVRSPIWR